ncbi:MULTISPECIES: hypothetical protein [unclassified Bradyrhizobium]|uniref:hypothetical protein n=1 Tax=unclassified Bradyrhizobium TaxID=2631580 RepID=UPI0028E7E52D|nr:MULTISPECIES: hypothetical protein [unclassified Bradyrhizobium]
MLVQLVAVATTAAAIVLSGSWYGLLLYPFISIVLNVALLRRAGYWGDHFDVFGAAKVRIFALDDDQPADLRGISIIDAKLACQSFFTPIFERHIMVLMGQLMRPNPGQRSELIIVRHEGAHWKAHELFNKTVVHLSPVFGWVHGFSQQVFKISALSKHFNAIILAINEVGFHTFDVRETMAIAERVSLKELRKLFLYHLLEELEHSYECVYVMREINPLLRLAWTPVCLFVLVFVNLTFELFALSLLFQYNWKAALRYLLTLEFVLHFLTFLNNITRALVIVHFVKFPPLNRLERRHQEYTRIAREKFLIDLTQDRVKTILA